jgi:hypothetical protein
VNDMKDSAIGGLILFHTCRKVSVPFTDKQGSGVALHTLL